MKTVPRGRTIAAACTLVALAAAPIVIPSLPTGAARPAPQGATTVEADVVAGDLTYTMAGRATAPSTTAVPRSTKGVRVWSVSAMADHGVPRAALRAYKRAAAQVTRQDPGCELPWTLLAAVGRVESDHGRYGGSILGVDGVSRPRIIGVRLDGRGPVAAIRDTDRGRLDRDRVWDRAVGPMQFIPSTWRSAAQDGDRDGAASVHDLDDAAAAAATYLCSGDGSLLEPAARSAAVFRYNQDAYYVALVTAFERGYRTGVFVMPPPPMTAEERAERRRERRAARIAEARAEARTLARKRAAAARGATSAEAVPPAPQSRPGSRPTSRPKPSASPVPAQAPLPSAPAPSSPAPTGAQPTALSGMLTVCGTGLCLGVVPLVLDGAAPDLVDSVNALVGQSVTLLVRLQASGAGLVVAVVDHTGGAITQ